MDAALSSQFFLFFAFICLLSGLALFIFSFIKRGPNKSHEEVLQQYKDIITKAQTEAQDILTTASKESTAIITEAKTTNEHVEEDLNKILHAMAEENITQMKESGEEFTKSYDKELSEMDKKLVDIQESLKKHTEDAIKESEKRLNDSLENYLKPLTDTTTNAHVAIDQRVQELVKEVEAELGTYKKTRMNAIDADIKKLVERTYQEVLRESIPDSLQERLIIKSLEKAKQEGITI